MGRVGYGPSLYGPSWLWAEFVMGRVCYGSRCPVTLTYTVKFTRGLADLMNLSDGGGPVYGQLVLLPTRTESTRTFSLVHSYFFATRTLVNSYFFLCSARTFHWSTRTFSLVNSYFLKKILYDMLCYFIMALLVS